MTYDEIGSGGGSTTGSGTIQATYVPSTAVINGILTPGAVNLRVSASALAGTIEETTEIPPQIIVNFGVGSNWVNTTNASGYSNSTYASCQLITPYSKELRFRDLDLNLPTNSTIIAVQVTVYGFFKARNPVHYIELIPNNDVQSDTLQGPLFESDVAVFGNLTDTALETWNFDDTVGTTKGNSALFGFSYTFSGEVDDRCFIDAFTVRVRYRKNIN